MTAPVEDIERLLAIATPGPWEYRPYEFDDWGFIRGPEVETIIGLCKPVVALAREGWPAADYDEHRRNKTDPYGPNALLIVAAVNALPQLLARIRTLEAENAGLREASRELAEIKASPAYQRFVIDRMQAGVDEIHQTVADFRNAALTLSRSNDDV